MSEMDLAQALEEYRQERNADRAAVELLREYLIEYAEITDTAAVTPDDLEQLFARWYLRRDDADPAAAPGLVAGAEGWLRWIDARSGGTLAVAFAPVAERLREDLPRVLQALAGLSHHAHREDVDRSLAVDPDSAEEEESEPVPFLSSGLSRVIRPAEVDYGRAEEDHFRITALAGDRAELLSPAGGELGEAPLSPVFLPADVAGLLRVGDILHVEVAPTGSGPSAEAGWEVLEVSRVFPGGYHGDAY
jgi:hypothetical protein